MSGSSMFCVSDLKNPGSLAAKLRDVRDPLSEYLRGRFSSDTQRLLDEYEGSGIPSQALQKALVDELNRLVKDPGLIQDVQRYAQIIWSDETRRLVEQHPHGEDLLQLNRLVLEGAYPQALMCSDCASSEPRVHVDKIIYTPSFRLGPRVSYSIMNDPKHILFLLARYKFCAKMLQGKSSVLEVGCGDAFGSPIVAQVVEYLYCIDREPILIKGNRERFGAFQKKFNALQNIEFHTMDIINIVPDRVFDAAFSIDVIEHLKPEEEDTFVSNICGCLTGDSIFIVGTPNIEAARYETEPGASPHVNLKSHITLKQLMDGFFANSFIFSMNDEVVHTGFYPMAHYLFGIGVGLRR